MNYCRRKRKWIAPVLAVLLLIILANVFQNQVRSAFHCISNPFQASFWTAGEKSSDFIQGLSKISAIKDELDSAIQKNAELEKRILSLKNIEEENDILKRALDIDLNKKYELFPVKIISKNKDSVVLNKGSRDGLAEGMPLITEGEIILGKIAEVHQDYSRALLISDKSISFDVFIAHDGQEIPAFAEGKGNLILSLGYIPQERTVAEGDIILTSSLGGVFPKSLMVGRIKNVLRSDTDSFQSAEADLYFSLTEIKNIFAVKPL
ncbi:MAG: hypothetical protein A2365_02475 [Candidatus Nealsonbacteria bacterium RIFOXYB1_FULL_40_15]|uniref:Cell shape-determining protein MreC n=2 Tax=Candidatus Nealsoniibacteriota TaxID=1817911 RepID=A0A1G2EPB8_9BACT|nr:MAG: hypothetical protein A2365_02475 [Candidatus Nealsonbacteria bacterium RIFOXYB1_FULL_40_15]OGZ27654.1 MAG: hypothetical protein A2427_02800 [Candidatus Nealsonbacteria bacterium RIFOXYC1_FULL_40_7]OGZ28698.1 MAG: hypothetical protein A2562_00605 [Candidatus Nealsonbacteria bacterium RIFOXYD1_FULL_39_11]